VETTAGIVPDVGCTRWFDLSITSTGTVAHCCMDGQAAWPIGNVATQHALEIYNAPHYRLLRERALTRLEASPCRTCTFL
jgi:radical SAM protein with 4Fe4S-binding SPASM domain